MRVSLAAKSVFCVRKNYLRNDVAVCFDLSERIRISAAAGSQIHPSCFSTSGPVFLHYVFRSDANPPGVHQRLQFFCVAWTLAVRHHGKKADGRITSSLQTVAQGGGELEGGKFAGMAQLRPQPLSAGAGRRRGKRAASRSYFW